MAPGLLYPPGDDPSFTALRSPDISKELRGEKKKKKKSAQACASHTSQGPLKGRDAVVWIVPPWRGDGGAAQTRSDDKVFTAWLQPRLKEAAAAV